MERFYCFLVVISLVFTTQTNGASIGVQLKIKTDNQRDDMRPWFLQNITEKLKNSKSFVYFLEAESNEDPSKLQDKGLFENSEEQDSNYPYDEINKYLKKNPHLLKYFSPIVPNIGNRGGEPKEEGESMCTSRRQFYYTPRELRNTKGEMLTIINDPEHRQFVEKVTCTNSGECSSYKVFGFTTKCVQQYATRRLMIFKPENNTFQVFDDFLIPSCCVCKRMRSP